MLRAAEAQTSARLSAEETLQTLHELRVHQIELELQNEELREAQAELEVARARYFDLYDLAPVGYVTLSQLGLILEANLTATELLGVTRGALVQQALTHFIVPHDQDIFYRHRKQLLETGAPQACELQLRRAEAAAPIWARLEMTVVHAEEGSSEGRIVISDITDRKQSEEALRVLAEENARLLVQSQADAKTKAILLQEVNHRVKNNLAAIVGLLQLELRYPGAGQQTPYQSLVKDLTGRVQSLALVHNLLSANQWASLPLDKLAEDVLQIAPVMVSRQQPVEMEISSASVHLSPKQATTVGLILNELATNSLKYASNQNERVLLQLQAHTSGDIVDLEYRDNGRGYPDEILQGTHKSVGLYLIEALAEHDLGGQITFSNDQGAVTRLRFALVAEGSQPARPPEPPVPNSQPTSR
jgi:PAS domain S-box-containing protein